MAQQTPVLKNQAYTFTLGLPSVANSGKFASGPTLAAGDVQISKDGGALVNLASLPTSTGKVVVVALSATEMNADNVTIVFSDQAGDEWQDVVVNIQTVVDRFSTHSAADVVSAMQVVASDFQADVSGLATSASIAALNDFNPATDTVANVTLVGTVTTNTDMRGTDNALLASGYTSPDNSGITQIQTDIAALNDISIANVETAISNQEPVSANITQVNGVSIQGQGTEQDPFGP